VNRRLKYLGLSQASWTTIAVIAKTSASMSQIELPTSSGGSGDDGFHDRSSGKGQLVTREPSRPTAASN